tara:strand:- start:33 stop:269 length:237 start_codon:yes stop_codon:yes gene_type:complete
MFAHALHWGLLSFLMQFLKRTELKSISSREKTTHQFDVCDTPFTFPLSIFAKSFNVSAIYRKKRGARFSRVSLPKNML